MSISDFKILNPLGKGAFASVSKVERKSDGKIYALKRVNISKMSKREVQDAVNEIRILASVRHPHIVSFLQAFLDRNGTELCIIMEYCGCGDLAQKVDRYKQRKQQVDERVLWAYLIQMADALKHLHSKHIVHRDIKTANCFLSEDGSIKVGDLNVSKKSKNGLLQTQIGTPYYMSPEIWNSQPYDSGSDLWALGCTIYELAALRPPFLGNSFPLLKKAVLSGRYPSMPRQYSSDLVKVIGSLIRVNPRDRPSAAQLLEMPEVVARRNSDWFNKLPSHEVVGDVAFVNTIKVPRNLQQLNFPQPCYPDARPHSPEAWPATDKSRPAAIEQKNQGGAAQRPSLLAKQQLSEQESKGSENARPPLQSRNSVKQTGPLIPQPPSASRKPLGSRQATNASNLQPRRPKPPTNARVVGGNGRNVDARGRRVANAYNAHGRRF